MKIAIVGGGVAAFEAAVAARKCSAEAEITLYSREMVSPYRRPALSGMVAHELDDSRFFLKDRTFYDRERIELRLGKAVSALDIPSRRLILAGGGEEVFDRLILATGGHAFIPPVPGLSGERVAVLREFSDLCRLRALLESGGIGKVAVLGGGVLGLELAAALLERGCAVTIVESASGILPCNLDAEAGREVFDHLAAVKGLSLRFGVTASSLAADGVLNLSDGSLLEVDLVCVSAGVRPNIELAAAAGIPCGRGILVDDLMRVSGKSDIFAAGDAVEWNGRGCGLYSMARLMGRTAGTNAAGGEAVYIQEATPVRLSVFGLKIFSAGCFSGMRGEGGGNISGYRKLFYDAEGRLRGVVLMGDLSKAMEFQSELCRS